MDRPGSGSEVKDITTFDRLTPLPVIDAHMHVFPDRLFQAIRSWFDRHAWRIRYRLPAEDLITLQQQAGIRGLVLLTYAHKTGLAHDLNRFMADLVSRHPGTVGFGTVHPDDDRPDIILKQAFGMGLAGCKLHCHVLGRAMDEAVWEPIYETCLAENRWLLIHAGTQPAIKAYGLDVTAISGVERVKLVLERHPELKLIIPHLGFDQTDEFFDLLDDYPNLYLDTTMVLAEYFPIRVDREKLIRYSHRIMYGSDFPNIPYGLTREVGCIVDLDLGERATADILGGTANRLFGFFQSRSPG